MELETGRQKRKKAGAGEKQTGFATLFIMKVIIIIIYIYHMIIIIMKVKLVITRQKLPKHLIH